MEITKSQLQFIVRNECKSILAEQRPGSGAWSENGADCNKEFFGILLGYLGDDAQLAGEFCKIAMSSQPGQGMDRALHDFNISSDAGFELLRAFGHIFGEDDPEFGAEKFMREGKKTMKITKQDLKDLILREIKIAFIKSPGGCLGEQEEEETDIDSTSGAATSDTPLPANFGSWKGKGGGMGGISEDEDSEDVDPPAGGSSLPLRPRRLEVDEVIDDIIGALERAYFKEMPKSKVIELLEYIANIYTGS